MASESCEPELAALWSKMEDLVNNTFDNIICLVNERREVVLSQFKQLRDKKNRLSNSIEQLRSTISLVRENLNEDNVIDMQEKTTVNLNVRLTELKSEMNISHVFVCDQKELNRTLTSLGSFEILPLPYMNTAASVQTLALGNGLDSNLQRPMRLSVDESLDLIAITDPMNNRVCLFSLKGQFINSFGTEYFSHPFAVKIINHNEIIISDSVKQCMSLIHFDRNKKGRFKVKLTLPETIYITALDFDSKTNLIYATESLTHSLLIFNKEFKIVSELKNQFIYPQNIFINNEEVYVQDFNNPSLHILSITSLTVLRSIIPRGISLSTEIPLSFYVDNEGYILIGDLAGVIQVYSPFGQMLHSFSKKGTGLGEISSPNGICVLANYDVIVISNNPNFPIQLF